MGYKKIPLAEQLERAGKYRVHPEHDACAVRAFGDMPLCDYMKNEHHRTRLGRILNVTPERLEKMTVRETAVLISRKKRPGKGVLPFGEERQRRVTCAGFKSVTNNQMLLGRSHKR